MLEAGTILTGSTATYRVEDQIGQGGASVVYRVVDPKSHRFFAAKVLSFHRFPSEALEGRFQREIKIQQRLEHPNVIRFHEVIDCKLGRILITEYASAGSLYQRLAHSSINGELLSVAKVIRWAWYIARGLSCLHSHNTVHRDLTPRNILFRQDDLPAIADFGISRHIGDPTMTQSSERLGSLIYISPQQRDAPHRADPQDDVFSIGQIIYHAATGIVPHGNPPPLNTVRPDFPASVARAVEKMRSFRKQERPKDGTDVMRELEVAALDRNRDLSVADQLPLAMLFNALDHSRGAIETLLSLGMLGSYGSLNLLDEGRGNVRAVANRLAEPDDDPLALSGLEQERQLKEVAFLISRACSLYANLPLEEQQEFLRRRINVMEMEKEPAERKRALAGACRVALFRGGTWEGWVGRIQDLPQSGIGILSPIDPGVNTRSFRAPDDSERTDDLVGSGHAWLVNTYGCAELIKLCWDKSVIIRNAYESLESPFIAQIGIANEIQATLARFLALVQRVSAESTWCPVQANEIPGLLEKVDDLLRDHETADVSDG